MSDGGPRPFNGWWFEAHAPQLRSGGDHWRGIAAIKEVLRGREDRFRTVAEIYRPDRMTIYGGLHHDPNEPCGVWLDPEDMALISRAAWVGDLISGWTLSRRRVRLGSFFAAGRSTLGNQANVGSWRRIADDPTFMVEPEKGRWRLDVVVSAPD